MTRILQVLAVVVGLAYVWWCYAVTPLGILMRAPGVFYAQALLAGCTVAAVVFLLRTFGASVDRWLNSAPVLSGWRTISRGWWPGIIMSAALGFALVALVGGQHAFDETRTHWFYIAVGWPVWMGLRFLVDIGFRRSAQAQEPG